MSRPSLVLVLMLSGLLTACAVNPVTGKQNFNLVSQNQEVSIGEEQYSPSLQAQGGIYEVDPRLNDYVSRVGKQLAAVSDRKDLPYEFVVINSSVPNAWALPGGKIAINRGLLTELHNEAELAAVLSHEIVHAAAGHGAQQMSRGKVLAAGMGLLTVALQDYQNREAVLAGSALGLQLISSKYSRDHETESDEYGIKYMARAGYDTGAAVGLQETLLRLSGGNEGALFQQWFASHPPSSQRVEANRRFSAQYPPGKTGEAEFKAALRYLNSKKAAYASYDEGVKAAASKQWPTVLSKARAAAQIEGKDGLFPELEAYALYQQGDFQSALQAANRAVNLNPRYYSHYLIRGQIEKRLGNTSAAKADFVKSSQLLPTATASEALGSLLLAEGQSGQAERYLKEAAESNSEAGERARLSLLTQGLKQQPGRYVLSQIGQANGKLVLQLANASTYALNNIEVVYQFSNGKQLRRRLEGTLPARQRINLDTGLSETQLKALTGVAVAHASLARSP